MYLFQKNSPRWLVFTADMGICLFSAVVAYLLRFDFSIPVVERITLPYLVPYMLAVRALSFALGRSYAGIVRYTGTKDMQRIFTVVTAGSLFFALTNAVSYFLVNKTFFIPRSILIIDYLCTMFLMTGSRLMVKIIYLEITNPSREKSDVVIFGAGESGIITKRALDRDAGTKLNVKAFLDDDAKKAGKKIEGVPIYRSSDLGHLLSKSKISSLVISIQDLPPSRKQDVVDVCLIHNTKVLNVPPVQRWINGELSYKQIRRVRIEDLLERDPIVIDTGKIQGQVEGKTVLITGAAGSIGSEIVRQAAGYRPARLVLLDQAESPLYELELEMTETLRVPNIETVIGDVRNRSRMENVFRTFRPNLVYHAAAYKHVPVMENNPSEAILTNILGTKHVSDLSVQYGVEKFVMVSTDKAVNPSNVMGASKRIAEMYAQALNSRSATRFVTTRFGNVLGSNGSVIPRFRRQIENGGPVTITHPEITRYFMTIREACSLVLEAGAMGKGGEVFIFDMGKSVKIADLAKKMIHLSGLTPGKDIEIRFTSLRPGEKLYEELLADSENTLPTHHPRILIARVPQYDWTKVSADTDELIALFGDQDNERIVSLMKAMVPEYRSRASEFERLDKSPS